MYLSAEQISTSNSSANTGSDAIVVVTNHPTSDVELITIFGTLLRLHCNYTMSWTRHVASTLLKNAHSLRSNAYMARRAPWCIFQLQTRSLSTMDDVFERARAALQRTESNVKKLTPEEAWAHRSKRLDLPAPADRYAGECLPNGSLMFC